MQAFRRRAPLPPVLLLLVAAGCGGGDEEAVPKATLLARERAAAYFAESEFGSALNELRPLADDPDAAYEDLIHAACVALQPAVFDAELARGWIARAAALQPDDPRTSWARYRLAKIDGDFEGALAELRKVEAHDPDDLPTRVAIGGVLDLLERTDEARAAYLHALELGPDFSASWYRTAAYRMQQLERQVGNDDEAARWRAEFDRLGALGIQVPSPDDFDRGTYGSVAPPPAALHRADEDELEKLGAWTLERPREQPASGVIGLFAATVGASIVSEKDQVGRTPSLGNAFHDADAPAQELAVFGPAGLSLGPWSGERWELKTLLESPVSAAAEIDLGADGAEGGDGDLDLVAAVGEELVLLANDAGAFARAEAPLARLPGPASDVVAVDFDHEGDLDLLVAGAFGARLLRNDAAHAAGGGFTDATADTGLKLDQPFRWCAVEDFDGDNDVDLLLGGAGTFVLASNERGGRFADAAAGVPAELREALARGGARFGDVDHDGRMDVALEGDERSFFAGLVSGGFERRDAAAAGPLLAADLELWTDARTAIVDAERAGVVSRVALAGAGADARLVTTPATTGKRPAGILLALRGAKDNRRGKGALVEIVFGSVYRRLFWRGEPVVVATHGAATIDVLRVSWPNGVVQNAVSLPGTGPIVLAQREGLTASCPFLYAWNGSEYAFISDVLGITPLGLPMAPGALVPPDHDEYVLISGDALVPRDGFFELQLTEELREVTYLDRVRLDAVDHPAGTEVYPNERFTFPPFPDAHTHTVREALRPARATGSDGADWTAALFANDGIHADPLVERRGQLLGLAQPHFLELEFDAATVRAAPRLRLVMTGWLYWTDASVNVAAARHPAAEFVPPLLQVPDGAGGWRTAGEPLGFPAGKTKTMVVDVTDRIDRADPRIRIFSTLALYWDSIWLAVDADDAPLRVTSIEPASAELWLRGFSKAAPYHGNSELEVFVWDELEPEARWNQHPGLYTKLGPCLELLTAIDDRFAVLGAGDALTLRFPADLPPPEEGFERDYLVYLDGWAKDRDPNTLEALYVEPLPFHGMSGYPYGPDERFPDGDEHRRWRAEWQTRPEHRWIPALAPAAK